MLTYIMTSFLKRNFVQCLSHHRCVQGFLSFVQQSFWDVLGLFTRVLAQHNYSRITGFSFGPFSKIMGCAKAVLGVHSLQIFFQERPEPSIWTTASEGRSDGDVESEAVQLKLLRQQMY